MMSKQKFEALRNMREQRMQMAVAQRMALQTYPGSGGGAPPPYPESGTPQAYMVAPNSQAPAGVHGGQEMGNYNTAYGMGGDTTSKY